MFTIFTCFLVMLSRNSPYSLQRGVEFSVIYNKSSLTCDSIIYRVDVHYTVHAFATQCTITVTSGIFKGGDSKQSLEADSEFS